MRNSSCSTIRAFKSLSALDLMSSVPPFVVTKDETGIGCIELVFREGDCIHLHHEVVQREGDCIHLHREVEHGVCAPKKGFSQISSCSGLDETSILSSFIFSLQRERHAQKKQHTQEINIDSPACLRSPPTSSSIQQMALYTFLQ